MNGASISSPKMSKEAFTTYAEDVPEGGKDGLQVKLGGLGQVGVLSEVLQTEGE